MTTFLKVRIPSLQCSSFWFSTDLRTPVYFVRYSMERKLNRYDDGHVLFSVALDKGEIF